MDELGRPPSSRTALHVTMGVLLAVLAGALALVLWVDVARPVRTTAITLVWVCLLALALLPLAHAFLRRHGPR